MRKLKFNQSMIDEAVKKAKNLGSINNSITSGGGNLAGYLAEIALAEDLQCNNVSCDEGNEKYNYDLIKNDLKIDVKTKRRTVDPRSSYEVSIAETSKHQKADTYAFISITFKEKRGKGSSATYHGVESIWLCGFMPKKEYFEQAKFWKKGDVDPSNGFTVHANMYNMPISRLKDAE
tara:strand:+ start:320 stop:850 length:531 start_codon:yes stop_codon:yes gene_type:complete